MTGDEGEGGETLDLAPMGVGEGVERISKRSSVKHVCLRR